MFLYSFPLRGISCLFFQSRPWRGCWGRSWFLVPTTPTRATSYGSRVVWRQASAEQKTKQTLVIRMADLREALAVGSSHFGDPTSSPGQWDGAAQWLAAPCTESLLVLTRKELGSSPEPQMLWVLPFPSSLSGEPWIANRLALVYGYSLLQSSLGKQYLKIADCSWQPSHWAAY